MSTAHTRTLRRALDTCGGNVHILAQTLQVPPEELYAWLAGRKALPTPVYIAALDVVARGRLQGAA